MSRLSRALEQLPQRHRQRGPEAILAGARHDARRALARRRGLVAGSLAATLLLVTGLAVWATTGDDPTSVETGPLDAPAPAVAPEPDPDGAPGPSVPDPAGAADPAEPTPTDTAPAEPEGDPPGTIEVAVFFGRADATDCRMIAEVVRQVEGPGVLRATMEALLAGPTAAERDAGATSWFSEETAGMVNSVAVSMGTARVDFDARLAPTIPNASTSCGSAALLAQLDSTARQVPTVGRVIYSLDGDIDAFYTWLQGVAPEHAPQWDGELVEDWPIVRAPGFDEYVQREQPSWAFDPREAALVLLDLASRSEPVDVEIGHGAIDGGRTVVHVTQSGFFDDSVNAEQHRFVFEQDRDGGLVRFVEGTVATRCQPGRGHQDFRPEPCI